MKRSDSIFAVIFSIPTTLLIILIAIVGLFKECADDTDPLDRNNFTAKQEYVDTFDVTDSCTNGFRITYSTVRYVTPERLAEIKSRKHIQEAFKRLRIEAPIHFGNNMLETNIYDFAAFAKRYDCDKDIQIHCIFITGKPKIDLYTGINPNIENCATWINPNTEQGVQWINNTDVYNRVQEDKRVYRYWKCNSAIYGTSRTDERFNHFSENERIR